MAYDAYNWGTTDYVTPSKMNHMEQGIKNIKEASLDEFTPTTGETWRDFLTRIKSNFVADGYAQYRILRMTIDGTSNMIFHPMRWTTTTTVWESSRSSDTGIIIYQITTSSSSAAVRKFALSANGLAITLLSDNEAESSIRIMGLNNNT